MLSEPRRQSRPTRAEQQAAAGKTIPDVIAPGLRVLFCGINPGLYSAATGHHFARPGNRFWPALAASGFTSRLLHPSEQEQLLDLGLGITNVVARSTARADELSTDELIAGGRILAAKLENLRPRWLAVVGLTAYRMAFGQPGAVAGPQDSTIGGASVWLLPNPSGLNASYQIDRIAAEFGRLRAAAIKPQGAGMTIAPPEPDCWLHPDVKIDRSPISGCGLFATAPSMPVCTSFSHPVGPTATATTDAIRTCGGSGRTSWPLVATSPPAMS